MEWNWQLIVSICVAATVALGCVGFLLYLYLFSPSLSSISIVHHKEQYVPGEELTLAIEARAIDNVVVQLGADDIFTQLAEGHPQGMKVHLPHDMYSEQCVLRVFTPAKTDRYYDTKVFKVIPYLTITSEVMKSGVQVYVPGVVVFRFQTDTNLISNQNIKLQTSQDGKTFADIPVTESFLVDMQKGTISWNATSAMVGQQYVKVTTDNLVQRGYKEEIASTTPHKVNFLLEAGASKADASGNTTDGLELADLQIRHADSASGEVFFPGSLIYLTYSVAAGTVGEKALVWSYNADNGPTQVMKNVHFMSNSTYAWTIPSDVTQNIRFRLEIAGTAAITKAFTCTPHLTLLNTPQYHTEINMIEVQMMTHGATINPTECVLSVSGSPQFQDEYTLQPGMTKHYTMGHSSSMSLFYRGKPPSKEELNKLTIKVIRNGTEITST